MPDINELAKDALACAEARDREERFARTEYPKPPVQQAGELEPAVMTGEQEDATAFSNQHMLCDRIQSCIDTARNQIGAGRPSRELSLAITKLEEAELWIKQHFEVNT